MEICICQSFGFSRDLKGGDLQFIKWESSVIELKPSIVFQYTTLSILIQTTNVNVSLDGFYICQN